ncbi:alpha/beta fold hydrolase [Leptospira alstonii]|uniref:Alpha/beta hydrolase family protein n=2 Tax=Leptospira alstonii TaxID=28452 RepID=M6CWE5_9LEPT|nr:alpha/beta fold hydrolase [Leptospira alstonii]EMJ90570.1 alpha/beta hydrolase family protein [Leptospira alstonii serovar Sichuan str. 79601]EQA82043.1 alpha/beta hydrolase family protein [Leptospira alstonii serovar Pingchang str. 80-412]
MSSASVFFFPFIWFCLLLVVSCTVPEDLKKKPEESLIRLKEAGVKLREFYLDGGGKRIYGVAGGCESENQNILIFIHGSPGGWQNYAWYLENKTLTAKYCILTLDRPGFGKSEPNEAVPDVAKQADILEKAIEDFLKLVGAPEKVKIVLVGHSYGGPIAAKIAISNRKIHRLVLLAGPLSAKEEEIRWYNRIADWRWVNNLLPNDFKNSNDEMLPLKFQLETLEKFWKNIPCGIILIHGKKDSLVPFQNLEFFKTQFSESRLTAIVLEEEDHFIPWTQKKLLESLLLEAVR